MISRFSHIHYFMFIEYILCQEQMAFSKPTQGGKKDGNKKDDDDDDIYLPI